MEIVYTTYSETNSYHRLLCYLLDNIFTNCCDLSIKSGTLFSDISDNLPIFQITLKGGLSHKNINVTHTFRSINSRSIQELYSCLQHVNWETSYLHEYPNSAYNDFLTKFLNLYNNYFPIRRASGIILNKLKPWMSNRMLNSIKYKNKLYKKFIVKRTNLNRNSYKHYRNRLNSLIKVAKVNYYAELFSNVKYNIKQTWKVINSVLKTKFQRPEPG